MAGDLTITGKRKDIKLIRFIDNKYITNTIDLTSDDFLQIKIIKFSLVILLL